MLRGAVLPRASPLCSGIAPPCPSQPQRCSSTSLKGPAVPSLESRQFRGRAASFPQPVFPAEGIPGEGFVWAGRKEERGSSGGAAPAALQQTAPAPTEGKPRSPVHRHLYKEGIHSSTSSPGSVIIPSSSRDFLPLLLLTTELLLTAPRLAV